MAISVNRKFFPPTRVCFAPKGYPWNWVPALGVKNYGDGATGMRKKFDDIFSRVHTIHQRDGRTDRRTDRATAKTALTHSVAR